MADLIERQIHALAPLGSILVCGGGALPVGAMQRVEAHRVIVMEPDPVRYLELARQLSDSPAIEVLQVMAGNASAKQQMNRYNLRAASSLRSPTGLKEIFPGLDLKDQIEVRVCDVAEIAKRIHREPGYSNMLIVRTPGEEAEILLRLKVTGCLHVFDHVLVPLAEMPLFAGSRCASELSDLLRSAGYTLVARDAVNADVPLGHFYRFGELQAELEHRNFEVEELKQRLSQADAALKQAREAWAVERDSLLARKEAEAGRIRAEANRIAAQYRAVQSALGRGPDHDG